MIVFSLLFALVPALGLLTVAILQRASSRQPVGTVIAEYAPLPGATVLYDAVMSGSDARALPAALVDLAIRKKIRLLTGVGEGSGNAESPATARPAAGRKRGAPTRGPLSVELVEGATFSEQERRVLAVFLGDEARDRAVRRLSTDRGATGRRAAALLEETIGELAGSGLITARAVRWPYFAVLVLGIIGIVLTALFAIVCVILWTQEPEAPGCFAVTASALGITIVALVVSPRPWRRFLPPSLPVRRHLEGMREYIRLAEAERLRVLESPQGAVRVPARPGLERILVTERLLPYAILFGEERQWAEVLRAEASRLDPGALEAVEAAGDVVFVALQLAQVAVTIVDAAATVGQVVDAGGSLLGGIGDLLSIDL